MCKFSVKNDGENRGSGISTFLGDDKPENVEHLGEEVVGREEMSHRAVRVKREAKTRLGGDPIEEVEDREWG